MLEGFVDVYPWVAGAPRHQLAKLPMTRDMQLYFITLT